MDNLFRTKWSNLSDIKRKDFYETMKRADLNFIDPAIVNAKTLETSWERFIGTPKSIRRRSDWVMLDFIGCTNEDMYNIIKSDLLKYDLPPNQLVTPDDMIAESAFVPQHQQVNTEEIIRNLLDDPNFFERIREAEDWMIDTGFVLIPPIAKDQYGNSLKKRVDELWDAYNMLVKKHRRVSDWKSMELFGGLDVYQIYTYLQSVFMKQDIEEVLPDDIEDETPFTYSKFIKNYCFNVLQDDSAKSFAETMVKLTRPSDNFNESINKSIISDAIDKFNSNNSVNIDVNYTDLPSLSPQEMIDFGVFSHVPEGNFYGITSDYFSTGDSIISGEEILEWFKLYEAVYNGFPSTPRYEELNKLRVSMLECLNAKYDIPNCKDKNILQAVIEMGWNPAINFSPKTRVLVDKIMNSKINSIFGESKIIDLCEFETIDNKNKTIYEDSSVGILKPIFLCFEEGSNVFSALIKGYTRGIYSHAALAFDAAMDKIYSYGFDSAIGRDEGKKAFVGGITKENIKNKNPEKQFAVYTVFVEDDIYNKIKTNVEYFVNNAKETAYSYANIVAMLFHIPIERNNKMICSQFVDRMLKVGGINITNKSSGLVDPNYLRRSSKANKTIYKIYEGKVKNYNKNSTLNKIKRLLNTKAKAFSGNMNEFALRENTCFFSSSLEILGRLSHSIDENSKLYPVFEYVYKPCLEAKGIIMEKDDFMFASNKDTVERGYDLIAEFNRTTDSDKRSELMLDLKEMRKFVSREMTYVLRPALHEPLKKCRMAIEDTIRANSTNL